MARTGLGRGLDVLLGSAPPTAALPLATGTLEIPLEQIQPNRQQPRQHFDQASIAELAGSITTPAFLPSARIWPSVRCKWIVEPGSAWTSI